MQQMMKTHALDRAAVDQLLDRLPAGALCTQDPDGAPYPTPVHFAREGDSLYVHCLPKGQRLDNLARCPRVAFTTWEMEGLILDPGGAPCRTNTAYKSVIATGNAVLVEDPAEKERALKLIVAKYTPQLTGEPLPPAMVRGTAVIRMTMETVTGKYYE